MHTSACGFVNTIIHILFIVITVMFVECKLQFSMLNLQISTQAFLLLFSINCLLYRSLSQRPGHEDLSVPSDEIRMSVFCSLEGQVLILEIVSATVCKKKVPNLFRVI